MTDLHVSGASTSGAAFTPKIGKNVQNPADIKLFDNKEVVSNVYKIAMSDGKADFSNTELGTLKSYYNQIKSKVSASVANFVDNILHGGKNYSNEEWAQIVGNIKPEVASRAEKSVKEFSGTMEILYLLQSSNNDDAQVHTTNYTPEQIEEMTSHTTKAAAGRVKDFINAFEANIDPGTAEIISLL